MTQFDFVELFLAGVMLAVLLRSFLGLRRRIDRTSKPRRKPRKRSKGRAGPRRKRPQVEEGPPPNAILVDGSNVMHWGGEPSEKVLIQIILALKSKGYAPVVVFDASVGYRLGNRYMGASDLAWIIGLPLPHVYVVHKGVVADEVLLDLAQTHSLRVVTNDRYRDWRDQFPGIGRKGALVPGVWQDGTVKWKYGLRAAGAVPAA